MRARSGGIARSHFRGADRRRASRHLPDLCHDRNAAARSRTGRRLCGARTAGVEAMLRFAVGAAMVPHGMRMCLGYFKGTGGPIDNVPAVAALYDRKGFRPGWFWAGGTVLTQFVAAPWVALGLFTQPMALPAVRAGRAVGLRPREVRWLVLEPDGRRISGDVGARRCISWSTGAAELLDRLLLGFEF